MVIRATETIATAAAINNSFSMALTYSFSEINFLLLCSASDAVHAFLINPCFLIHRDESHFLDNGLAFRTHDEVDKGLRRRAEIARRNVDEGARDLV